MFFTPEGEILPEYNSGNQKYLYFYGTGSQATLPLPPNPAAQAPLLPSPPPRPRPLMGAVCVQVAGQMAKAKDHAL